MRDGAELVVAALLHSLALDEDQVVAAEVQDDVDVVLDGVELLAEVLVYVDAEYAERICLSSTLGTSRPRPRLFNTRMHHGDQQIRRALDQLTNATTKF